MIDILFFYCPYSFTILHVVLSERAVSNLLKLYLGKVAIHMAIQISSTSSFSISPTRIYSCFFLGM